jgi:hypothetical protein
MGTSDGLSEHRTGLQLPQEVRNVSLAESLLIIHTDLKVSRCCINVFKAEEGGISERSIRSVGSVLTHVTEVVSECYFFLFDVPQTICC